MGCSFDRFNVNYLTEEQTNVFAKIFNEKLKDDLYWGESSFLTSKSFIPYLDGYSLELEDEPMFKMMDNGYQLIDVVLEYIKNFPDEEFIADYYCTFNNCGAVFMTDYEYDGNGKLTMRYRASETEYLCYCEECDSSFWEDPICMIEDYEESEIYHCPNCGAHLEWDVDVWDVTYELKDGVWARI